MKLLEQVKMVFVKHEWRPLEIPAGHKNLYRYLDEFPEERKSDKYSSPKDDRYFINKYRKHIPPGWYGFSLGNPIIPVWCDIIEEVIELCITNDPDFEIHQIKVKMGRICFYTDSNIIEDTDEIDMFFERTLSDPALVY
ncbi:MAG: hypothetical protein WC333_01805 [Dehalococcoidia bacterium]|jgi:hypothetical protein